MPPRVNESGPAIEKVAGVKVTCRGRTAQRMIRDGRSRPVNEVDRPGPAEAAGVVSASPSGGGGAPFSDVLRAIGCLSGGNSGAGQPGEDREIRVDGPRRLRCQASSGR